MTCLSKFLDRKAALEPGWGVGDTKPLLDDGVEPGPGEEEDERRTDEWFVRRILMMEETVVRRGRDGQSQDRGGRGSGRGSSGRGMGDPKGW